MRILVAGEALIDFIPIPGETGAYTAAPGGSPLNVALGLARLGVATGFLGRLSRDAFGDRLRDHLAANDVDVGCVLAGDGPTTLAFVIVREDEEPAYAFYADGTADRMLLPDDLPPTLPEEIEALHVGSYALAVEPIGGALEVLGERERGRRILSLDPNVRPALAGDRATYVRRLEAWIERCDVIKLSRSDAAWCWPDRDATELATGWIEQGAGLVVVTGGAGPVVAFSPAARVEVAMNRVEVVDTVGAGDAFTAGLLCRLAETDRLDRGALARLDREGLRDLVGFASRVAALTCGRRGADPPRRDAVPD